MKNRSPKFLSALSTMGGHVIFVAKDSSISVMIEDQKSYGIHVVPAPLLAPSHDVKTIWNQQIK